MSDPRTPGGPDDPVDRGLAALGGAAAARPLGDLLAAELAALKPVDTRAPRRQLLVWLAASLGYVAALLAGLGVRGELAAVSLSHVAIGAVGFAALGWLIVVPKPGHVMPRARLAGALGIAVAALVVVTGFLFGTSEPLPPGSELRHGSACVEIGLLTAVVPAALAALLVRGSVPVARRWAAAGVGAAGGALGGLLLGLHCAIDDRWHVGPFHGGVVVVATLVAVVLVSLPWRVLRRR